jgi:uncharacterized cupredoxin-like copper-binding protein
MHVAVKKGETVLFVFNGRAGLEKELRIMVGHKETPIQPQMTSAENGRSDYHIVRKVCQQGQVQCSHYGNGLYLT